MRIAPGRLAEGSGTLHHIRRPTLATAAGSTPNVDGGGVGTSRARSVKGVCCTFKLKPQAQSSTQAT